MTKAAINKLMMLHVRSRGFDRFAAHLAVGRSVEPCPLEADRAYHWDDDIPRGKTSEIRSCHLWLGWACTPIVDEHEEKGGYVTAFQSAIHISQEPLSKNSDAGKILKRHVGKREGNMAWFCTYGVDGIFVRRACLQWLLASFWCHSSYWHVRQLYWLEFSQSGASQDIQFKQQYEENLASCRQIFISAARLLL